MKIQILTIFPEMFTPLNLSIMQRAQKQGVVEIEVHNLRNWTDDSRKTVDDKPFGGGPGMVMMVEPIYRALADLRKRAADEGQTEPYVILTSAKGASFDQTKAQALVHKENIIIICGHYEGVDERVAEHLIDEEISIGSYVLTGGELPAMVMVDAITRLIPGVLGNMESLADESFNSAGYKERPHYTRPAVFTTNEGEEWGVPDVLTSGNHAQIEEWRKIK